VPAVEEVAYLLLLRLGAVVGDVAANKLWKVHKWWPVFVAMPRMIHRLSNEDLGLLGHHIAMRPSGPVLVQYWRSADHLQRFARDSLLPHLAAWRMFNRRVGYTGDVGFWHETFVVQAGGPHRDQFTSTVTRQGSTGAPHGISGGQTSRYEARPPRPGWAARYAAAVVPGGGGAGSGSATRTSPLAWTGVHQLYGLGYRTGSTESVTYSRCHRRRQMVRPLSACPSWIGRPVASVGTQPVGATGSAGAAELAGAGAAASDAATITAVKRVLARTKPPPEQPTYPPESIFRRTSLEGPKGQDPVNPSRHSLSYTALVLLWRSSLRRTWQRRLLRTRDRGR
jgi:hypothetical protein